MFSLIAKDGKARTGTLHTRSGTAETPFFMPVATKMAVKYLSTEDLHAMGCKATISNAFILFLRPGDEVIKELGSIKKLMHFNGVNVTDSGGFQMYSESFLLKTTDEGIHFQSPFDGVKHLVTPEKDMDIQLNIGSDVAMALDSMPLFHDTKKEVIEESVRKTTLWAKQCKQYHDQQQKDLPKEKRQLLFGITQGGIYPDLREQSIKEIMALDFDGYSVGGLGMGEPKADQYKMVELQRSLIPEEKPMYVMGIGSPLELLEGVERGADMFDSRFPTQNARRGTMFTSKGKLRLMRKEFEKDITPIDEACSCKACKHYTRAFIRFLLAQEHSLGFHLATVHNIHYLMHFMQDIREAIKEQRFQELKEKTVKVYKEADAYIE